jgi:hypothetical protein
MAVLERVFINKVISEYAKKLYRAWRTGLKNINIFGEYAKRILPYMENTPIDIKVSLSRPIFDQTPEEF